MAEDYQKVAALLSMDIQTHAMAAASHPKLAEGLMAKLEERRLLIINDDEYRDRRYAAATTVFNAKVTAVDAIRASGEEEGE